MEIAPSPNFATPGDQLNPHEQLGTAFEAFGPYKASYEVIFKMAVMAIKTAKTERFLNSDKARGHY